METALELPRTVGRYTLTRELGQGGMGIVYAGRDERLDREVAVKMISGLSDARAVKRFWREARAAASVSHPNVCQIFEVDEYDGGLFIAMELLEGEALDARLARGPCPPADAARIALETLSALGALHDRGLVHRDIKPSNVFLTMHGVKLLDFGLARRVSAELSDSSPTETEAITRPGMIVGTPRYMAPEQILGGDVDGRTDLYAVGTVLFEMLAGRPPFIGDSLLHLAHAIAHENPPALQGPPAVVAIDRVIRRALAKDIAARFQSADAMAVELRGVPVDPRTAETKATVKALLRLVVPPLRLLREDPEIAFLSYGLAEAVSGSLAGLTDVVVRSSTLAGKWTEGSDPRELAAHADVDMIVSGSLSRMGDQLRIAVQLVEASSGTVAGATSVRGSMRDIFAIEDELTKSVVALLTPVRATSAPGTVRRDVPANGRAFELFLRGLELARSMANQREARELFEQALHEDPAFAPAWAWLGRCHRVIGKYQEDYEGNDRRAEEAFRRALALSPELPTAHRFFTHYQSEHGAADAAIARLLQYAKANRNDAQLFAGLVHALRYGGLNGASIAAHHEARRLDPTVPTSVEFSLLVANEHEKLQSMPISADGEAPHAYMLLFNGRDRELRDFLRVARLDHLPPSYRGMTESIGGVASQPAAAIEALMNAMATGAKNDPEAVFLAGMVSAYAGQAEFALEMLGAAVRTGFSPVVALEQSPVLATARHSPRFPPILDLARQRRRIALAVFERGAGPALLGISPEQA
ncbi:MAG TPA: protein kinase [Gemmatimonadaceae bacterium]|nr:protein kinase [Gemmatimonadaceae bacterium]